MIQQLYDVIDATWPAASKHQIGPYTIRQGNGGGSRVSCATGPADRHWLDKAEAAMHDLGQVPIFMIRDGDSALDALLAERGYHIKDPVTIYSAPISAIDNGWSYSSDVYDIWPPIAVQREIWENAGIGKARLDIMTRAKCPNTTVMGRVGDVPAGTGFIGIDQNIAMIHALEVAPNCRRQGVATLIIRRMALWAKQNGADQISLVVTNANSGANALYQTLGFDVVGHYHYRTQ